jgi:glycosyltransferase involved in cell wall biosynthesis
MLDQITPLILTLNEAPNLERTLAPLAWARDIVVVDSGSTDDTCAILARDPRVRVFERRFTSHAEQWNFGLMETGIATGWVLALDADYVLEEALVAEIGAMQPPADVAGYRAGFIYCIEGRPLRGTAYPPVTVLYRKAGARYSQDGHTQRVEVAGRVDSLAGRIRHDDRKPLSGWLGSQARYMRLEADKLLSTPLSELGAADRLRRMVVFAPAAMLLYCLFVRGNILDGRAGLYYALQRATAEAILSLCLLQKMLGAPR